MRESTLLSECRKRNGFARKYYPLLAVNTREKEEGRGNHGGFKANGNTVEQGGKLVIIGHASIIRRGGGKKKKYDRIIFTFITKELTFFLPRISISRNLIFRNDLSKICLSHFYSLFEFLIPIFQNSYEFRNNLSKNTNFSFIKISNKEFVFSNY